MAAAVGQCTINYFVRQLDTLLCFISGGVDLNRDSSAILDTEAFKNCEFKERTYRLTFESHEKDENGDLILSQDPEERDIGLSLRGGKQRIKLSLSYYDSSEEEIPDDSIKPLLAVDLTFHETKTLYELTRAINLVLGGRFPELNDPLHLNSFSPKRIVVNHHFRYTPPTLEEGGGNMDSAGIHNYIIHDTFCDWITFNASTVDSKDHIFNFVYGGPCKTKSILQYRGPHKYRCIVSPDGWLRPEDWINALSLA